MSGDLEDVGKIRTNKVKRKKRLLLQIRRQQTNENINGLDAQKPNRLIRR